MLTIDIHTHIIPEIMPDFAKKYGYGGFVQLEHHQPKCAKMMIDNKFFREIQDNCWSPETRIAECIVHNVDIQVLSTIPVMFSYWAKPLDALDLSRFLNDHIAEIVAQYPTKFIGLGTVPLQSIDLAIKELERCINVLNLAGVQIGSHVNSWNLDAEELFPFFEAAERLGAAVFVHPWEMMGRDEMPNYWLPWLVGMPAETCRAICSMIFGGVFERLPKLRVAFAHGGGSFPSTIGRIEHGFNERPDLCAIKNNINPREYLGKFYVDALVHDPMMLRYLIEVVGVKNVAMGSDYPFPLGETVPGSLIRSMSIFSDSVKERLLNGTALEWLGLDRNKF